MIDNFEGSSTKKQEKNGAGKESTKEGQCMYIFCSIACTDRHDWCHVARVTIDMVPDVALLEIFGVYTWLESWYTLVHVCRKWRNVVFGSPCRLNLRLLLHGPHASHGDAKCLAIVVAYCRMGRWPRKMGRG